MKSKSESLPSLVSGETVLDTHDKLRTMLLIDASGLIGRTFLMDEESDGQRHCAKIVELVEAHEGDTINHPERLKFVCSVDHNTSEEVFTYNELMDYLAKDEEDPVYWKMKRITSHQGPLNPKHPNWNGSSYNVMVEWETGEITSEPLTTIAADDLVTCALYAKENDLLELPGWKRFKPIAKRQDKLLRMVNQAKLKLYQTAPKYQYRFQVLRDCKHAVELDRQNGNTKWQDATKLEMKQLDEYKTFKDLGANAGVPAGNKKIRVHLGDTMDIPESDPLEKSVHS